MKIISKRITEFQSSWLRKKSNICVALQPSEFHVQLSTLHSSGFCAPPDLKRGLNFLLCHPKIDFLRDCQPWTLNLASFPFPLKATMAEKRRGICCE